jgi:hypothetical protein
MSDVMGPEDYFWRIVERDLEEFVYRGGPYREAQNRALAHRYDVPWRAVYEVWIGASRLRERERERRGA